MDYIEIKIRGFSKYIKRSDIKTPNWFAVEHNLLLHPDFFSVSGDEVKAYLWIVGTAAHLNEDTIRVYPDVCASQIRIPVKSIKSCIEKLSGKRWDVTDPLRVCTGNIEVTSPTVQYRTGEYSTEQGSTPQHLDPPSSDALVEDPFLFSLVETVKPEVVEAWFKTYGKVWVIDELKKAKTWCLANKNKAPKTNYSKFLTNWLSRGWETHRKGLPTNSKSEDMSYLNNLKFTGPEGAA